MNRHESNVAAAISFICATVALLLGLLGMLVTADPIMKAALGVTATSVVIALTLLGIGVLKTGRSR